MLTQPDGYISSGLSKLRIIIIRGLSPISFSQWKFKNKYLLLKVVQSVLYFKIMMSKGPLTKIYFLNLRSATQIEDRWVN